MTAVWLAGAALIVAAAWGVAWTLARGREGATWADGSGRAMAVIPAAVVLVRLVDAGLKLGGPLSWVGVSPGAPGDPAPLALAFSRLVAALALVGAGAWVARRPPTKERERWPMAAVLAGVGLAGAVVGASLFLKAPVAWTASGLGIDVAAAGVAFAIFGALHALGRGLNAPHHPAPVAEATQPRVDVGAVLARLGLDPAKPLFERAGRPALSPGTEDESDTLWHRAGGRGRAPAALKTLLEDGSGTSLVADLPEDTERALVTTLVLEAVSRRGERVLVVTSEPAAWRGHLRGALNGSWPVGRLVAGSDELAACRSAGVLPSVVFADVDALSGSVVPWLAASRREGRPVALDRIVVVGADRIGPVDATHLLLTMRRLSLALTDGASLPEIVATGSGAAGTQAYLERLAHRAVRLVPVALKATAPVRVYRAPASLPRQDAALEGRLSLETVADTEIGARYRASANVMPLDGAETHVSLWRVEDSALARFLLLPRALEELDRRGELPTPRPIAGRRNRWLLRAHLEAALSEGASHEVALREAFGEAVVADRLERSPAVLSETRAAWIDPASGRVRRAPRRRVTATQAATKLRRTVTTETVELVDEAGGRQVALVDAAIAAVRFHPSRVFEHDGARYRLGTAPIEASQRRVPVSRVDSRTPLTQAETMLELTSRTEAFEPTVVGRNGLSLALAALDVTVTESVDRARTIGGASATVSFARVTATYPSEATVVFFERGSARTLEHLARSLASMLPAHVRVGAEDADVVALPEGFGGLSRPALAFVDRHVGGMGLTDALDGDAVHDMLRWARLVLQNCGCLDGCARCTPPEVIERGADKQGVLLLLGAGTANRRSA